MTRYLNKNYNLAHVFTCVLNLPDIPLFPHPFSPFLSPFVFFSISLCPFLPISLSLFSLSIFLSLSLMFFQKAWIHFIFFSSLLWAKSSGRLSSVRKKTKSTIFVCHLLLNMPERIVDPIYPTPPLGQDMTQGQFFKAEFNRFDFRVFLLLD